MTHTNPVIGATGWGTTLNTALDAIQADADAAAAAAITGNQPTSTTAALAAIGNAINTTNKVAGKTVYNTTTKKLVTADGSAAGDVWVDATGATAHTPV